MSLERNKELARAAIAIWSTCDFSQVLENFTADYVVHQHHDPDGRGDLGLKAMRAFAHEFRTGFPDFHDTIDLQLSEGDLVATRFTSSGTHTGPFQVSPRLAGSSAGRASSSTGSRMTASSRAGATGT